MSEQTAELTWSIRYWRPDSRLAAYVSGYHDYTVTPIKGERQCDTFFPAWTNIRMTFQADPWSINIGTRRFDPVPENALFGPTSHAGYSSAGAGRLVGVGLTPAGWARLFPGKDLSRFANRVTELEQVLPDCLTLRRDVEFAPEPAEVFNAYLLRKLDQYPAENAHIAPLMIALNDISVDTVQQLADRSNLSPGQLLRLAKHVFGFTPKLLMRRARFLRTLDVLETAERGDWKDAAIRAGYWDGSHFLRDCHLFLGQALGAYLKMPRPLNRASRKLRSELLGAPMQSLHR